MKVSLVDPSQAERLIGEGLGVAELQGSLSSEWLSEYLRHAIASLGPSAETVVNNVAVDALGAVFPRDVLAEKVPQTVESMIALGDIIETQDISYEESDIDRPVLILAPPAFVERPDGNIVLLGGTNSGDLPLSTEMFLKVRRRGILRILAADSLRKESTDLPNFLSKLGFNSQSSSRWFSHPKWSDPRELISDVRHLLDNSGTPTEIPSLRVLDPETDTSHYKSRWCEAKDMTGEYVCKRSGSYGRHRWGFVRLRAGVPQGLIEFPLPDSDGRPVDDAWLLQMAIDAVRGKPQIVRITNSQNESRFDFHSPIPSWARRYFDLFGLPESLRGPLFSYSLPNSEVDAAAKYLKDSLWLRPLSI